MNQLDHFLQWIGTLPDPLLYILLGVSAFVENVFPPIPGDTITAFGAFLVGTRRLSFLGVYTSTTIGSVLGFAALFRMGAFLGRRYFMEKDLWFLKARHILKADKWFKRYGYGAIVMNRFFPGIRSAIALLAGFSHLRLSLVILLSFLSACVWNLIWIAMGYTLGNNWETVQQSLQRIMSRYNTALFILFALVGASLALRYWLRRKRRR